MVFIGDENTPEGTWPVDQYTTIPETPLVREKPYLVYDESGYAVMVPPLRQNSVGPSWNSMSPNGNYPRSTRIPIEKFYIAQSSSDTAETINLALQRGLHLILSPGVYQLDAPIVVRNPNTVVLGLGLPSLVPTKGNPAVMVSDVDGVTLGGILFDAGVETSPNLLQWGEIGSNCDHSANPSFQFDCPCRIGGATPTASTNSCVVVNSNNLVLGSNWLC